MQNGVRMPQVGLGVWRAASGEETVNTVTFAVRAGYRHIDTAAYYQNEKSVGEAVKKCGVPRSEIFITTKLWNNDHGYDKALAAFERSRAELDVDYVDLYLIHWPGSDDALRAETWRAMEKLYAEKKVRAIGVSNFEPHHLDSILSTCTISPMVNQVEMNPNMQQSVLRRYCRGKNIAVTAWRPLGLGKFLEEPVIMNIAKRYNRTPAQVIIRWFVQLGVTVIPKSVHEERIKENFDVFDFELDEEAMQAMVSIDKNERMGGDPNTFF